MNLFVSPSVTNQTTTIFQRIFEFANKKYGEKNELLAWKQFCPFDDVEFPSSDIVMEIFWPWYCYSWSIEDNNIAFEYLMENYSLLSDIEKMFIGSCIQNLYSFLEVKQVHYGQSIVFKDLISNQEYFVFETRASRQLQSGNIIFGKIAEVMDLNFLATGSHIIPSKYRSQITKKAKKVKTSELNRIDLYFDIFDQILIEDKNTMEV